MAEVFFSLLDSRAVVPTRAYITDAGYDLTVFEVYKDFGNGVKLYRTGLSLEIIEEKLWFQIYARSSLAKLGYLLANGVGVIDNGYRGEIYVSLYKFDAAAPELIFPVRVAQLVPQMLPSVTLKEATAPLTASERGTGGFGSTN